MNKEFTDAFFQLVTTVRRLRGNGGCPWDQKQTTASLSRYLNEEFQEIIAAIEKDDMDNLCEELGDFLYLIIMLSEINHDLKNFSLTNTIHGINEKLIRRHPHVFAGGPQLDEDGLRKQWQSIKEREKKGTDAETNHVGPSPGADTAPEID